MKKNIFKSIPIFIISSSMLFAQYYDTYDYQNNQTQNSYNAYQNDQNNHANNYYNNYYQEFIRTLSQEANNPNSIYYSPQFYNQYNNYNAMDGNPYQYTMNAMNWASQNYNNQPYNNNGAYNNYNNQAYNNNANYVNPYEELMKMLEKESQNPNSPYYSPNANQNGYYNNTAENQNGYYNGYNSQNDYYGNYTYDYNAQDPYNYYSGYEAQSQYYDAYDYNKSYNQTNNMSENPYKQAAEALIKAAEELTKKANGMQNTYEDQNLNNNNANTQNAQLYIQDFYTPFKVPQVVLNTAAAKYPNVQILDVEMKEIGTYEVRMANNMRLYIDRNGNLLYEKLDY